MTEIGQDEDAAFPELNEKDIETVESNKALALERILARKENRGRPNH